MDRLQLKYQAKEGKDDHILYAINDKVNDCNSFGYALGCFLGPVVGSALADALKSPYMPGEIMFVLDILVVLFLFTFNCGFTVFQENHEFQKKLRPLKNLADN